MIERLWPDTVARAGQLPESALRLRVDDERSFIEKLRHLVFATDAWVGRTILDEPMSYTGSDSCTPPIRPRTPRHSASTWTRARRWPRCWRYAKTAWR
jgi:hypothetical protein